MADSTYEARAAQFDSVQRLYVGRDSPHVSRSVPASAMLELQKISVAELQERAANAGRVFDTSPFDTQGRHLRFFPGHVTVWSGFPGAGKTTLLRQLICHLLLAGRKVFFASLEEDPRDLLLRLMRTAAGTTEPNAHQMQWFLDAYGDRLRVWNSLGDTKSEDLLSAIGSLKVDHAFIDSLMALDVSGYEWEAQRMFAKRIVGTARISTTHMHLVAHPRKPDADELPEVHHIAGTADLGRLADNVIFVRRQSGEDAGAVRTGMKIQVRKQRHHTGALCSYDGWFHRELMQFHQAQFPGAGARYLPADAYE